MKWWTWRDVRATVIERIEGRLLDLSPTGCRLETTSSLDVGEVGVIEIRDLDTPLTEAARVCRTFERPGASARFVLQFEFLPLPLDRAWGGSGRVKSRLSFGRAATLALTILLATVGAASGQQVSQIPGVASPAAWRALEEHRFADAAELFDAASRRAPRDATLRFGAGVANLLQGKNAEARQAFEAALAIDPLLTDASVLLGYAFYRDGQLQGAINAYESALRHAPNHPELAGPLEQWRKEAITEGQFSQAQGAHFTVYFEGPADDAGAHRALDVLEDAYLRIGRELAIYPQRPLSVVLYTKEQFHDITRTPEWASGVYDGRIKVPMAGASESVADLRRVLEHELVHALVAVAAGPTVPAWLNEGLATALEPAGAAWAEEQLRTSAVRVPLAQLTRGFRGLSAAQARAAYAQSALAVKALLDQEGAGRVVALLQAVGRGVPFAEAFHQSVAMTLDEFAAQFAAR